MADFIQSRLADRSLHKLMLLSLLCAATLFVAFQNGIGFMLESWQRDEYSHGWLIPAMTAMMVLVRVPDLPPARHTWSGLAVVAFGLLLLAAGELSTIMTFSQYALLVVLVGLVWSVVGPAGTALLAAPLLYLGFMVPLPEFLYSGLSAQMQLVSSELGVAFLRLVGVSVFLEGNVIDLGVYKLEVAEACSGLRYLFPMLSFTYLSALLMEDRAWKRWVMFLSAIPITIVMNSVRIAVIGVMVNAYGIGMAEGALHLFEGWIFFLICTVIIFALGALLVRVGRPGRMLPFDELVPKRRHFAALRATPVPGSFMAATIMVAVAGLTLVAVSGRDEATPDRRSLVAFPLNVEGWTGRPSAIDGEVLSALKLTDYVLADYTLRGDRSFVNFYVAYYGSQRAGAAAHSPQACIPGGGWEIASHSIETVDAGAGRALQVNRLVIAKGEARQLVYYWFDQRGRNITNEYAVKAWLFWDALTRNRTDGALVRLTTPMIPGESEAVAERRLRDFLRSVDGSLGAYVPA